MSCFLFFLSFKSKPRIGKLVEQDQREIGKNIWNSCRTVISDSDNKSSILDLIVLFKSYRSSHLLIYCHTFFFKISVGIPRIFIVINLLLLSFEKVSFLLDYDSL